MGSVGGVVVPLRPSAPPGERRSVLEGHMPSEAAMHGEGRVPCPPGAEGPTLRHRCRDEGLQFIRRRRWPPNAAVRRVKGSAAGTSLPRQEESGAGRSLPREGVRPSRPAVPRRSARQRPPLRQWARGGGRCGGRCCGPRLWGRARGCPAASRAPSRRGRQTESVTPTESVSPRRQLLGSPSSASRISKCPRSCGSSTSFSTRAR